MCWMIIASVVLNIITIIKSHFMIRMDALLQIQMLSFLVLGQYIGISALVSAILVHTHFLSS